jgi:hypothetical protein
MRASYFLGSCPEALPTAWLMPQCGFIDLAVERLTRPVR